MNFTNEYKKYEKEIIEHTMNLVRIPSVLKENEEVMS